MRASELIPNVAQHRIQDSTKIISFMTCPRMYFYEYVLGWRPETPNNHLVFGQAWHKAMEVFAEKGYAAEQVMEAYQEFLSCYREVFGPETDDLFHPKTPDNALIVLANYAQRYAGEDSRIEVLHVEVGGKVFINAEQAIHFKMDTICKGPRGYYSLEHKTASSFYMWEMQWPLSMQIGTYTHVLHCLYPKEDVVGVTMNGVAFKKVKKGWEQAKACQRLTVEPPFDFLRFDALRNRTQMNNWLWTAQYWLDQIQCNFNWLQECSTEDPMLTAFPMNSTNCTKYNGCPWYDFCNAWANPLARCESPPIGYIIEHWDPSAEPSKTTINVQEGEVEILKGDK